HLRNDSGFLHCQFLWLPRLTSFPTEPSLRRSDGWFVGNRNFSLFFLSPRRPFLSLSFLLHRSATGYRTDAIVVAGGLPCLADHSAPVVRPGDGRLLHFSFPLPFFLLLLLRFCLCVTQFFFSIGGNCPACAYIYSFLFLQ